MRYKKEIVLAYFKECGLPEPELEYRFHPDRKWMFDFSWKELPVPLHDDTVIDTYLALEVQGGIFSGGRHNRGAAMLKEWEKLNAAAVLGWRILYCQPKDLCTQAIVNTIKQALNL